MSRFTPIADRSDLGMWLCLTFSLFFCSFSATAPTAIYTLSLHDALPIYRMPYAIKVTTKSPQLAAAARAAHPYARSEEHTSELQSLRHLVCRLLLEKKNLTKL